MNLLYQQYLYSYKKDIRSAFTGFGRSGLLNKLLKAIDLYNKDQYEKAIALLTKLKKSCKTQDDYCAVLLFTAVCYEGLSYLSTAVEIYLEMLEHDPTRSTAHSNLGLNYRRMGEFEKAIVSFEKAISCDSENPFAYNNLGLTYYRMGEYEKAVDACLKALSFKRNLYQAANCLCLSYFALKNLEESKKYFKIGITNGGNAETLKNEIRKLQQESVIDVGDDFFWDL